MLCTFEEGRRKTTAVLGPTGRAGMTNGPMPKKKIGKKERKNKKIGRSAGLGRPSLGRPPFFLFIYFLFLFSLVTFDLGLQIKLNKLQKNCKIQNNHF